MKVSLARGMRRWAGLPLRKKAEIVWVACLAVAAEVAVRFISLRKLTRSLGIQMRDASPDSGGSTTETIDASLLERADAVSKVYRVWPGDGSCLRRSVVLGFRLREHQPVLRLGVGRNAGKIEGHAWIEVDGMVVGEGPGDYIPLRGAADGTH